MIKSKFYNLSGATLSSSTLTTYINSFWNDTSQEFIDKHLLLLVKVQFIDGGYKTLADMRKVNVNDKDLLIHYLSNRLGLFVDSYKVTPISQIIFTYIVRDGLANDER